MPRLRQIAIFTWMACLATPLMAGGPPPGAGGPPSGGGEPPMIWLEPFSYTEMREMRERMKKMAAERPPRAAARSGRGAPNGSRSSSGRPAGGFRSRIIHLRDGAYPPAGPVRHARRPGGAGRPGKPGVAARDVMWLEKPDNEILAIDPRKRRNTTTGNYKTAFGGDYRIVAYRDAGRKAGRPTRLYGYYEFMAHGDKPSAKQARVEQARAGYFGERPEFEIIRSYDKPDERYRSRTGERARLSVLFRGKPLMGKPVTMITSQGWKQTRRTNDKGEAVFTLIKEDFPKGGVDKRKSSLYIARATHVAPASDPAGSGEVQEALHVATMSIRVAPSALEWESHSTAYLATLITLASAGFAIAIRRRRSKQKNGRGRK